MTGTGHEILYKERRSSRHSVTCIAHSGQRLRQAKLPRSLRYFRRPPEFWSPLPAALRLDSWFHVAAVSIFQFGQASITIPQGYTLTGRVPLQPNLQMMAM